MAVTWRGRPDRELAVRTHSASGAWTGWRPLEPLQDVPTEDSAEARDSRQVNGTDLAWVEESDGVQVRVSGGRPTDLEVVLIDPGSRATDAGPGETASDVSVTTADLGFAPPPSWRSRRDWGADESLRNGDPTYNRIMKQAHIHHTAGSNAYRRVDVPGIIRGMYWYHTRSLGWSDIGYNFLVDRFGRLWVGRYGGPRRKVRGAHTLGFNHQSVGVAVIGNFQSQAPSRAVIRRLVRLTAWKLDRAGRRPDGWIWATSRGSDKYAAGTRVRLRAIDGHRDTNDTACPGDRLYDRIPVIRKRAQARADAFN